MRITEVTVEEYKLVMKIHHFTKIVLLLFIIQYFISLNFQTMSKCRLQTFGIVYMYIMSLNETSVTFKGSVLCLASLPKL